MTKNYLSNTQFGDLGLPQPVVEGLEHCGFSSCTEIQALSLPHLLAGKDVAGQAQTGTGKTAAFLIAVLNRLLTHPPSSSSAETEEPPTQQHPRALIVAPTRELVLQIAKDAEALASHSDLKIALAYGGIDYEKQKRKLQSGVDILIGTPGRLIDYYKQRVYHLKDIQAVVLDEADRMFDLGFISDIRFLLRRAPAPEKRQSMLFSATLSHRVLELAYEHMNNPERVEVQSDTITADRVRQILYHPASEEKIPLLIGLMKSLEQHRSMVFVNTKAAAEKIERYLLGNELAVGVLSGDVRQRKRQSLLKRFAEGELNILIATDVAARGLHIPGVTHVFNFDLPQNAEDYVHRIGRTARAGAEGDAISFACESYAFSLMDIEEYIGRRIETGAISDELLPEIAPPLRRQKSASSSRRDGGGQRGRSGNRSRSRKPRSDQPDAQAQAPAATEQGNNDASANNEAAEKPKRRRRRRSRSKPKTESNATPDTAAPSE